ncbi:MAG: metallophosphoesterase family protein [Promethearchaeota archaeon]
MVSRDDPSILKETEIESGPEKIEELQSMASTKQESTSNSHPESNEAHDEPIRFIHVADLHLGKRQYKSDQRYRDFFRAFKYVLDKAIEEKVDFILICGDFFNVREVLPTTMVGVYKYLSEFKEKTGGNVPIFVIEGNHDSVKYGTYKSWIQFLASLKLVIFLNGKIGKDWQVEFPPFNPKSNSGGYYEFKGIKIYGMSYLGSITESVFKGIYNAIQSGGFNILMMHFGISGYSANKMGVKLTSDLHKLKERVNYFALGHYHAHYVIDNWMYNPGSIETTEITDYFNNRGFLLVEIPKDQKKPLKVQLLGVPNRKFVICNINLGRFSLTSYDAVKAHVLSEIRKTFQKNNLSTGELADSNLDKPVLYLTLTGRLEFPEVDLDLLDLRDAVMQGFPVLHLVINNEVEDPSVGLKFTKVSTKQIQDMEREVFSSLIKLDPQYKSLEKNIVDLMIDIKQRYVSNIKASHITDEIKNVIDLWWGSVSMRSSTQNNKIDITDNNTEA